MAAMNSGNNNISSYMKLIPPLYMIALAYITALISNNYSSLVIDNHLFYPIGWIIIGIGLAMDISSAILFARQKTTVNPHGKSKHLVTSGMYRISRNPMYVGQALMLTGWGIKNGYLITPLATMIFVIIINQLFIKVEEQRLTDIFGSQYKEYMKTVRRWL